MSEAVYVFDAFPYLAYSGQIDLDDLKDLVLEKYGYHRRIWGTHDTGLQDRRGRYKKVAGGTAMKPQGADSNFREEVCESPGDLTYFDDGSWFFEVDECHPVRDPIGHWRRDLSLGQQILSAAAGVAAIIGLCVIAGALLGE